MSIEVRTDVPLSSYTTLKVGGNAQYFIDVQTEDDLQEAVAFAQERSLRLHILGGGSNVLVSDDGVEGVVIHIALKGVHADVQEQNVSLTAASGEELDALIAYTVENGWWGLENLSHIPGTVGATPVQNVGAYGVEAKDLIASVRVFNTETGSFEVLSSDQCAFAYRDSIFKKVEGSKFIIVSVTYVLSVVSDPHISYRDLASRFEGKTPSQQEIREAVMKIRAGKFPNWHEVGTAGSFFKNPIIAEEEYQMLRKRFPELPGFPMQEGFVKIPLGWVLDKALSLRGYQKGNVSTYKDQALVVVAEKNATASEIEQFAYEIIQKIKNEIGLSVEWEVTQMK